jgi:hypothetical protein
MPLLKLIMRKAVLTIFTLLSLNCFGQKWTEYKMDSNLTVNIPENFEIIDTLGQRIVRAQIDNGLIMIQRIPNKGETATSIQNKEELIKNYTGFQKGVVRSQNGKLLNQDFIEKDGLQVTQFSYSATMGEELQVRHCLTVFLNENWYTINFWELEALTNEMKNDRDKLFSSIKFLVGQSFKNQLSNSVEGSRGYKVGFLAGKIMGYALMIAIAVSIIIWVSKRAKKRERSN